jgi:hypothetical protein
MVVTASLVRNLARSIREPIDDAPLITEGRANIIERIQIQDEEIGEASVVKPNQRGRYRNPDGNRGEESNCANFAHRFCGWSGVPPFFST